MHNSVPIIFSLGTSHSFIRQDTSPPRQIFPLHLPLPTALPANKKINPSLSKEREHQESMNDRLVLIHNLNKPGLAVDDVAVRNSCLGD